MLLPRCRRADPGLTIPCRYDPALQSSRNANKPGMREPIQTRHTAPTHPLLTAKDLQIRPLSLARDDCPTP